jgi:hypothetical protein
MTEPEVVEWLEGYRAEQPPITSSIASRSTNCPSAAR